MHLTSAGSRIADFSAILFYIFYSDYSKIFVSSWYLTALLLPVCYGWLVLKKPLLACVSFQSWRQFAWWMFIRFYMSVSCQWNRNVSHLTGSGFDRIWSGFCKLTTTLGNYFKDAFISIIANLRFIFSLGITEPHIFQTY